MKLLIPTTIQFKKWTMLHRLGYISAVIGILVGIIQCSLWVWAAYQWLQPAPQLLSVADKLLIDQHPTKLVITDVVIKKYDSKRDMVVLELRNSSSVTAKNVRVDFYNIESEKSPYSQGTRYRDSGSGIDIPAGETRSYRVALISDYENFFNPSKLGKRLLAVSKDINSKISPEIKNLLCKDSPCYLSTKGNSTIVTIKYGSIFGQKHGLYTQFYNTFLDS